MRLTIDDPYFSSGQRGFGGSFDQAIEINAVTGKLIPVAIAIPAEPIDCSSDQAERFLPQQPGRQVVEIERGFKGRVRVAFKSHDLPAAGIKGIGIIDDADGEKKKSQPFDRFHISI